MTLVDLGFGDQVAERKTLFSLLAADCHKLAKSLLLSLCCYSLCLRQCHHDHHPHDHHHHPPARHHLLHHLIKQMLLFVCRLFFWLALRATNSPTALMPNSFFTPTMSTEIARTLPSWKICQNICLRCKANIFARALIKIVQGKTDSASCRIPMHPNVSVSVFGFFNLSRSNSVLIFPACRKENSLHTVALCTALVAKSGSIASSKCSQIRRGAEKISKEQNTRRTLTFK